MPVADGGPAFPAKRPQKVQKLIGTRAGPLKNEDIYQEVTELVEFPGMSLRDWFAGQALAGWLASGGSVDWDQDAKNAYTAADALLAAREKYPPPSPASGAGDNTPKRW